MATIMIQHKILECGLMPNVIAALPNIGGALCESSVIPFLVSRLAAVRQTCCKRSWTLGVINLRPH